LRLELRAALPSPSILFLSDEFAELIDRHFVYRVDGSTAEEAGLIKLGELLIRDGKEA
jgi:hypothetical protein